MRRLALPLSTLLLLAPSSTTAYAESCKDYLKKLVEWAMVDENVGERRYVWFTLVGNQRDPKQFFGYMRGRLDYNTKAKELRANETYYLSDPGTKVTNSWHNTMGAYKKPSDKPAEVFEAKVPDPKKGPSISVSVASPYDVLVHGLKIVSPVCDHGVMYGWDDASAKTFYSISFNQMKEKVEPGKFIQQGTPQAKKQPLEPVSPEQPRLVEPPSPGIGPGPRPK